MHLLSFLKKYWDILLFAFGCACFAFAYGVAVGKYQFPPYYTLRSAARASVELWHWARLELLSPGAEAIEKNPHVFRVSRHVIKPPQDDLTRASHGLTFVAMFRDGICGMVLLDLKKNVIHRWDLPESLFLKISQGKDFDLRKGYLFVHGAHLCSNGDVVFNLEQNVLARIDKDSRLLWALLEPSHHLLNVEDDGTIWALSNKVVKEPAEALPNMEVPYMEECILKVSSEGEVQDRISILHAIFEGDYQGVLMDGYHDNPKTTRFDVTHANDVEIIDESFARANPFFSAGDILVSMRGIDALALIDREKRAVKWSLRGPFLRQHDPDCLPDGTISLFDNRTARSSGRPPTYTHERQVFGYSRILRIDPQTQEVVWSYQGSEEEPFYTVIHGAHQTLPNGNVLVVEAEGGRVFEVDAESRRIVWEFRNVLAQKDDTVLVGRITFAERFKAEDLDFLQEGLKDDG